MKMYREYPPRYNPNAAPWFRTSVSRSPSPATCWGTYGTSALSAIIFVTMSATTMTATTGQNTTALGPLFLAIFLALLALDAIPRVRQRIESLEGDLVSAIVTLTERFRRAVEAAKCLIDVPEEATFLAREQERLLAFHGVRTLVSHVERIRAQVAVGRLRRGAERLVVVPQLLQHAASLFE